MKTTGKCPFCSKPILLAVTGEQQSESFVVTDITANGGDRRYTLWHIKGLCPPFRAKNNKKVDAIIMRAMTDLIVKQMNKEDGFSKDN